MSMAIYQQRNVTACHLNGVMYQTASIVCISVISKHQWRKQLSGIINIVCRGGVTSTTLAA